MRALSTTKNLTKTAKVKGPQVHQIRAKGFNAGGYDPRASNNVKPVSEPRVPGVSQKQKFGATQSYLPEQGFEKGGRVQAMKNGKGKVISCQNY